MEQQPDNGQSTVVQGVGDTVIQADGVDVLFLIRWHAFHRVRAVRISLPVNQETVLVDVYYYQYDSSHAWCECRRRCAC